MKTLSTITLTLALAVGASSVIAAGSHGNRHNTGWNSSHEQSRHGAHQRRDNYNRHARSNHRSSHYNRWGYNSRHYRGYSPRHYRGYSPSHWRHSRHGWNYPSYIGATLVGSLIAHSAYHLHSGAVCYDSHERDGRSDNYNEVVGCHRIERLPDGKERRVEVPLSECN